jgi:hypothetical protein
VLTAQPEPALVGEDLLALNGLRVSEATGAEMPARWAWRAAIDSFLHRVHINECHDTSARTPIYAANRG